jgi:protocatechuate 3,4-dioxygenase alpha subunit
MTELLPTPSQTVGPFLAIVLPWADGPDVVAEGTANAIRIHGRALDGDRQPIPDGLVEVWQADPDGRFNHPDDPRGAATYPGFRGFGRSDTGPDGEFWFRTLKPGPLPAEDGRVEAPHLDVTFLSRGLLNRLVTRIYFPDEAEANAADPVLSGLSAAERERLTAVPQDDGSLRFDILIQGEDETPFFAL